MKALKLTPSSGPATHEMHSGKGRVMGHIGARAGIMIASVTALAGCINVTAPEEPIVIQLDINIRAEVLYRLAEDAGNTVEENADIF